MKRVMDVKQSSQNVLEFGGRSVQLDKPVVQYLIVDDKVIVLLNSDEYDKGDMLVGRNVLAYDLEGNQLWRVPDHGLRRPANPKVPDAYFGIYLDEKGKLWGETPGVDIEIDPKTGKLLKRKRGY